MRLALSAKIGDGAFADVWKAIDEMGREVAVKIIRPAGAASGSALAHARALARVQHRNVVAVFSVDEVDDPETPGTTVPCVVMELLRGETLNARLARGPLPLSDARQIGIGIVEGIAEIHLRGIAHGDLHGANVMVDGTQAKIIDLLYLSGSGELSTTSVTARRTRDITSLRLMLADLLHHAPIDPGEATTFHRMLGTNPSLVEIEAAYKTVADPAHAGDIHRKLDYALERVRDTGFVSGTAYAEALRDETPPEVREPLLNRIVEEAICEKRHREYVSAVWASLTLAEKARVAATLSDALNRATPKGKWAPLFVFLVALGKSGWDALKPLTRMRLEELIRTDLLAGHVDGYGQSYSLGGRMGTWAIPFGTWFSDRRALIETLSTMLTQNWFTQNYIGESFLPLLPKLADTQDRREALIAALVRAVHNDAKVLKNNLHRLPQDWQTEVNRRSGGIDLT
jgi:hypothetical protein